MVRLATLALLLAAGPLHAAMLVGTTAFGTLVEDAPPGFGPGTVAGSGFFPPPAGQAAADRQIWRYTFSLAALSDLRIEAGWLDTIEYHCLPGTFPCDSDGNSQVDRTFTDGIDRVIFDLTRAGGATRHYDPLVDFTPDSFDGPLFGEGFYTDMYDRSALLRLGAGDYTFDFTGYGAPGGPAFPGSGGGDQTVNFEAIAVAGGVPEPAAWLLLVAGFGLTGGALRRRAGLSRA